MQLTIVRFSKKIEQLLNFIKQNDRTSIFIFAAEINSADYLNKNSGDHDMSLKRGLKVNLARL